MPAASEPLDDTALAQRLEGLGPFEPAPQLAVAVSGGADSMALALLADRWARARGGRASGLIVDHGLRPESGAEAQRAAGRLAERGIAATILPITDLTPGPRLAERARTARYAALEACCAERGILHLLLAHHAADQAETLAMRMLRGSGPDGLACMAALVETHRVRLLRPLLGVPPVRLRATLQALGCGWIEDPSNADQASLRARLRSLRRDADGTGLATRGAVAAARARGADRRAAEDAAAAWLGRHATLHPDGTAALDALPQDVAPLAALLRVVAGRRRPPAPAAVTRWLVQPRSATIGGVWLHPATRPGGGAAWLLRPEPGAAPVDPTWPASPLAGGGFVAG